jgi:fructokinase
VTPASDPSFAVLGEALVDLSPDDPDGHPVAHPGGSPYNVAVGLARLGHRTQFVGALSTDAYGSLLRQRAEASGVDLAHAVAVPERTTSAQVQLDDDGNAVYRFDLGGTSATAWPRGALSDLPASATVLHFGSLASWHEPAATILDALVAAFARVHRGEVLISYDPNVRASLQLDRAQARAQVERSVAHAHLVKASEDDLEWLYAGASVQSVAHRWLDLGARIVVITRGAQGCHAFRNARPVLEVAAQQVQLVDTVGAGDAFTSGLLDGLARRAGCTPSALEVEDAMLEAVLVDASGVAAFTCGRAGADPPWRAELP